MKPKSLFDSRLGRVGSGRSAVWDRRRRSAVSRDCDARPRLLSSAEFYQTGLGTSGLLTGTVRDQFDQIRKHEVAHVAFLRQVLGSRAVSKPAFDYTGGMGRKTGPFADVFSNPATFAAVAQAFEDTGVRAYKGQAANLMSNDTVLTAALQIHSVEARHAAQVRRIRQQKGWITENYRGNLPGITQPIYNGDANKFHFILAQPGHGNSMSEAFDEPLTSAQVLNIVAPFIATRARRPQMKTLTTNWDPRPGEHG